MCSQSSLCRRNVLKLPWTKTTRRTIASFVSMMIVATGGAENTATQVTALIMAGASVIAYIIGEGLTDAGYIDVETGVEIAELKESEE